MNFANGEILVGASLPHKTGSVKPMIDKAIQRPDALQEVAPGIMMSFLSKTTNHECDVLKEYVESHLFDFDGKIIPPYMVDMIAELPVMEKAEELFFAKTSFDNASYYIVRFTLKCGSTIDVAYKPYPEQESADELR